MAEDRGPRHEGDAVSDTRTPTPIGIGVVEHRGRVLVGTRQPDQVLSGHAEFPGGKCRPGESARDCVIRECREETGLDVEPVELLDRVEFEYPHTTVDLHFWLCRLARTEVERESDLPELFGGFEWHPVARLVELNFPEANAAVVRNLAHGRS